MKESELSTCSAIEILHSFRDTVDSDTPSYTSDNALKAFEKLKELKEKISSGTQIYKKKNYYF